ncbi:Transglutaminase-like superfamily protein [Roseivivax sp. THAF40]|uniref:transglutaminase-like domain-containing protein n=1 Tax=unclassified Roseivivax TaxID=2639302 RepID=UPI001269566A|nr:MULTISPECIES: transglutaminase family protein [unclassified Roseivivax]QFS83400.1 Transglutaminase-like superfamily protein [Roseivivax sp. THAF197b]QFT47144.1 Transglutaminase-like superfamily protein [Roseivivax sp. THAF40]
MILKIDVTLDYALAAPTDCLVQINAAALPDQAVRNEHLNAHGAEAQINPAEDEIGLRLWFHEADALTLDYTTEVRIDRDIHDIGTLSADSPADLPRDVVKYLLPSRFCPSDKFLSYIATAFPGMTGGALAVELEEFVRRNFSYVPGASGPETSALETFVTRQGVCRDFAHMLVTLARAGTIPARVASCYGLGVTPQDFHLVAEVWLEGRWHVMDPTGMCAPDEIARICVGRDATDVAFLTSYGPANLLRQSVEVSRLSE